MFSKKDIGFLGEEIAKRYLEKKGYKILTQNFQKRWGELDIVAKKEGKIIFFEVKTQRSKEPKELEIFSPEEKISFKKEKQLRKISQVYLIENNLSLNTPYQIDILAINFLLSSQKIKIYHYKNAIEDKC